MVQAGNLIEVYKNHTKVIKKYPPTDAIPKRCQKSLKNL